MDKKKKYWFPAKAYGWGWGMPSVWQGWLVFAISAILLVAGVFILPPVAHPFAFQGYVAGVLLLLVIVCWITGEPPRWRWGK